MFVADIHTLQPWWYRTMWAEQVSTLLHCCLSYAACKKALNPAKHNVVHVLRRQLLAQPAACARRKREQLGDAD